MRTLLFIRLDDICETMNLSNFLRAKELLDRYEIKPLLGIVPFNQDPVLQVAEVDSEYLKRITECKDAGWSIAMHGTYHVYDTTAKGLVTKRPKSEFAGKPLTEQIALLKKGKEKMRQDGLDTDIFFAPGHSYDKNTVRALRETGFTVISDGRSHRKYRWLDMDFVPVRYFGWDLKKIKRGTLTSVFHLNGMSEADFEMMEEYIRRNREVIRNWSDTKELAYGNTLIARMDERIFVFYETYLHPLLSKVKHAVMGMRQG